MSPHHPLLDAENTLSCYGQQESSHERVVFTPSYHCGQREDQGRCWSSVSGGSSFIAVLNIERPWSLEHSLGLTPSQETTLWANIWYSGRRAWMLGFFSVEETGCLNYWVQHTTEQLRVLALFFFFWHLQCNFTLSQKQTAALGSRRHIRKGRVIM